MSQWDDVLCLLGCQISEVAQSLAAQFGAWIWTIRKYVLTNPALDILHPFDAKNRYFTFAEKLGGDVICAAVRVALYYIIVIHKWHQHLKTTTISSPCR